MISLRTLTLMAFIHAAALVQGAAKEPYEKSYLETKNPVRIFDWDTMALLQSKNAAIAKLDADSPEKLIAQLEEIVRSIKGAENIRDNL